MHPHLSNDSKQLACASIIQALEDCHKQGLMTKMSGKCNPIKDELIQCLRKERLERTAKHVQKGKERRRKTEEIWREIDGDK
ncbi:UPF0287-domain-containing protein [Tilletiaria anomala UBC 951]|uniref:COX assembly mitochondrial protein n=1 Tax=Tilletiaria anomala (strain ATCC 24038 / CBS 436.72 / UBC 951) TaxID=1037660 RepID=A0A066VKG8_TILAU|nr:UPF0287-domain-containing protein [Tilletiaria anomala UBC 951]KDN41961.1 UPF0287-domain-containing protein [Tilletiaria anomala UBC 951]